MTPHKCILNHKNGGGVVTGMDVSLCEGEYSCIHSVFNQWIKLSIYSSIDVPYDNCLSMLSRQRDTGGLSIIRQLKRKRWEETHESQVLDSRCMFNYSTATMEANEERESVSVRKAQVLPLCESLTWLFPCNGS